MRPSQSCVMIRSGLVLLFLLALGSMAFANTPASRFDENSPPIPEAIFNDQIPFKALGDKAVGDLVDFDAVLQAGANYLRHAQADVTEDNAGNGTDGNETPEDPDDGGWDFSGAKKRSKDSVTPLAVP